MDSHTAGNALDHRANLTHHFWEHSGNFKWFFCREGCEHGDHAICREFRVGILRRTRENELADLCAVYHFGHPVEHIGNRESRVLIPSPAVTHSTDRSNAEQMVFVRVIETFEQSKKRRECFVRSIVRLEPLDFFNHGLSYPEKWGGRHGSLKGGGIISDRKGPSSLPWGWIRVCSEDGDGVNEVVQSTSEVVDGIADNQRPPLKTGRMIDDGDSPVPGKIDVVFNGDSIRLAVDPGNQFLLEGVYMLLGTMEFCPYARKVGAHINQTASGYSHVPVGTSA